MQFLHQNKRFVLKEAAKVIIDDIVTMIQQAPILSWPPNRINGILRKTATRKFKSVSNTSTHHIPGKEVRYMLIHSIKTLFMGFQKKRL